MMRLIDEETSGTWPTVCSTLDLMAHTSRCHDCHSYTHGAWEATEQDPESIELRVAGRNLTCAEAFRLIEYDLGVCGLDPDDARLLWAHLRQCWSCWRFNYVSFIASIVEMW